MEASTRPAFVPFPKLARLPQGRDDHREDRRGRQRVGTGYGLDHKRFALFNSARWTDDPGAATEPCCKFTLVGDEIPKSLLAKAA